MTQRRALVLTMFVGVCAALTLTLMRGANFRSKPRDVRLAVTQVNTPAPGPNSLVGSMSYQDRPAPTPRAYWKEIEISSFPRRSQLRVCSPSRPTAGHLYAILLRQPRKLIGPGEPFNAYVELTDASGAAVPVSSATPKIVALENGGYDEPGGTWSTQRQGTGTLYTWTPGFIPPATGKREFMLVISGPFGPNTLRSSFAIDAGSDVSLTGTIADHRTVGALVVDVELEAKQAWSCDLSANLHGPSGEPLEHTRWSGTIGPGKGVASLEFSAENSARYASPRRLGCRSGNSAGNVRARVRMAPTT